MYAVFITDFPSGRVTRHDLLRIYRQFFPFGDPSLFIARFLRAVQADNALDNALDFAGFVRAISVISRGSIEEKIACRRASVPVCVCLTLCRVVSVLRRDGVRVCRPARLCPRG